MYEIQDTSLQGIEKSKKIPKTITLNIEESIRIEHNLMNIAETYIKIENFREIENPNRGN